MTTPKPSNPNTPKKKFKPRTRSAKKQQSPAQKKRDALKSLSGAELFIKAQATEDADRMSASNELRRRAGSGDAAKFLTIAKAGSLRSVKAEHQLREELGISSEVHKEFLELLKSWK